jgi:hypothetical protein
MLRVVVPAVVLALGVASGMVVNAKSSRSPSSPGYPPAVLAGRDFTPYRAGSTRGVVLSEGRVASSGAEIVAVGAESGQLVPRAQFFVSLDDGRSWNLGGVTSTDGGTPPPGHAARFIAGGSGAWAAIGSDSVWTSADGQAWTLTSSSGLPKRAGDDVTVLKRTSSGFIAAGASRPAGNRSSPVIFLSADGRRWTRLGAGQLHLASDRGQVQDIRLAAATGKLILVAGDVAPRAGGSVRTGAAWLSDDGGRRWRAVSVPAGHGAHGEFSDLAATANGFLLVRPATADGRPAADVYRSGNGTDWTFAATLTTPDGFSPGLMNGGSAGAVLAGGSGGSLTAFTSADGVRWRQVPAFGPAPAETVSGVAVTTAGAVIAAGTPGRQQLITIGRTADVAGVAKVSRSVIPGGVEPAVTVDAVAAQGAQGRQQVAVGSANGFPAAWTSADGGRTWRRAAGQTAGVLARPGIQQLTSVAHGRAGWLAVGGAAGVAGAAGPRRGHPVVLTSADGRTWSAADAEPVFAGGGLAAVQAAAGRDGYVIVGSRRVAGPGGQARVFAAAWWSAGVTGWHRAGDETAGALDGPDGSRQMLAVAATADGFVAVGSHGPLPAAWTTPDGRTWSLADLPLPAGATAAALQHVAAAGRTVVATGVARTAAGPVPYADRSADGGRTWTESALPVPAGTAQVSAVAAAGGGFTVTGTFGVTAGDRDVVVWTSRDGKTWQASTPTGPGLASPGIQAITGLTVSGRTLTGVGFTATPAGVQPTLWQFPAHPG